MPTVHAAPLPKPQRTQLENTVKAAREVAEKGARAALAQLAVDDGHGKVGGIFILNMAKTLTGQARAAMIFNVV